MKNHPKKRNKTKNIMRFKVLKDRYGNIRAITHNKYPVLELNGAALINKHFINHIVKMLNHQCSEEYGLYELKHLKKMWGEKK